MDKLPRVGWVLGWRLAVSGALFYVSRFAAVSVQQFRGRSLRAPISWGLSLHYCAYAFGLLAVCLAAWAALDPRGRRWSAVACTSLLYTVVASVLCGAFSGTVDRPYLFLGHPGQRRGRPGRAVGGAVPRSSPSAGQCANRKSYFALTRRVQPKGPKVNVAIRLKEGCLAHLVAVNYATLAYAGCITARWWGRAGRKGKATAPTSIFSIGLEKRSAYLHFEYGVHDEVGCFLPRPCCIAYHRYLRCPTGCTSVQRSWHVVGASITVSGLSGIGSAILDGDGGLPTARSAT